MQHAFDHLSQIDKTLKSIIDRFGYPKVQFRDQGFAAMCHIILEQQVSIESARATYKKLKSHLIEVTPGNILESSDEALRGCGISRQKIGYLKDMAERIEGGTLDFSVLHDWPETQILEKLLAIKGVGNWTAEVYLMFCLQSPDVIPFGDIAIRNAMTDLYGHTTIDEMASYAQSWKPFRTYASYLLWHHYLSKRGRTI